MCDCHSPIELEWEERKEEVPLKVHMIAGSLAGLSEHIILLPLDNIKTHLQTSQSSIIQSIRSISKNGFLNFYRGSFIIGLGCVPSHALFFLNYEIFKPILTNSEYFSVVGNMIIGASSSFFHDLIMTPCEMLKQRSQLSYNQPYRRIIADAILHEGFLSFWRSFPTTLISNLPNSMTVVTVNEYSKHFYRKYFGELKMSTYFICASLGGMSAAIMTTPLDNIKTRLNVQLFHLRDKMRVGIKTVTEKEVMKKILDPEARISLKRAFFSGAKDVNCACGPSTNSQHCEQIKYPNFRCTVKTIFSEEGLRGFYKGVSLRILTQSMSSGIAWSVYEFLKRQLITKSFLSK